MNDLKRNNLLYKVDLQIRECQAMIDHFIQLKQCGINYATEEIADWRKMLQSAKIYKRNLLNT